MKAESVLQKIHINKNIPCLAQQASEKLLQILEETFVLETNTQKRVSAEEA